MCLCLCLLVLMTATPVNSRHFNGGTIRWVPLNPSDNASSVAITVIQSYFWTMPNIRCANNVPISSPGWGAANESLTCVVDCSTDGGYSAHPVSILTDCISASSSMGSMTSERATNITLAENAHFYASYTGAAWRSLNSPPISGLDWSILFSVDLRRRSDGLINTPPVARIVSPQYIIANRTTEIKIAVSDANVGDDVRCRWSNYTSGHRRRRRSDTMITDASEHHFGIQEDSTTTASLEKIRKKRIINKCTDIECRRRCEEDCPCNCSICQGTTCSGIKCETNVCRPMITTTSASTTTETEGGTLRSTSSFPVRQAIDECGGICYPDTVPPGTTLSDCTLSVTGLIPGAWYAVAVQVRNVKDISLQDFFFFCLT